MRCGMRCGVERLISVRRTSGLILTWINLICRFSRAPCPGLAGLLWRVPMRTSLRPSVCSALPRGESPRAVVVKTRRGQVARRTNLQERQEDKRVRLPKRHLRAVVSRAVVPIRRPQARPPAQNRLRTKWKRYGLGEYAWPLHRMFPLRGVTLDGERHRGCRRGCVFLLQRAM